MEADIPVTWEAMKMFGILMGACGLLVLAASCAQPAKGGASKQEALRNFEQWKAEQERLKEIDEKKEEERQKDFAAYFRMHGNPTREDRERAIKDALKPASQRQAPEPGPGQTQHYPAGKP